MNQKSITIGWLYPELMSTYGDYGNIQVLKKRCEWRSIPAEVISLNQQHWKPLKSVDILFMGGAQDAEQKIVSEDLRKNNNKKANELHDAVENGTVGLFICGAYQFMVEYYQTADGIK